MMACCLSLKTLDLGPKIRKWDMHYAKNSDNCTDPSL